MAIVRRTPPNLKLRGVSPVFGKWFSFCNHASYRISALFPEKIPTVFVAGFPKSGTSWVTQVVSDYLRWPFIDLSFFPIGSPAVIHCHFLPKAGRPAMIYVVRDARDIIVSLYFHLVRAIPEGDNPPIPKHLIPYFRGLKNKDHVHDFLPIFIKRHFERPYGTSRNWNQHLIAYRRLGDTAPPLLRYEDLLDTPFDAFKGALVGLTGDEDFNEEQLRQSIERFSFERQTGRNRGEANAKSFLRSGKSGDWRNYFTKESAEVFWELYAEGMKAAGYEEGNDWISELQQEQAKKWTN